jgi:hypothetical protein
MTKYRGASVKGCKIMIFHAKCSINPKAEFLMHSEIIVFLILLQEGCITSPYKTYFGSIDTKTGTRVDEKPI